MDEDISIEEKINNAISQNEFELIGAGARRFPVLERKGGPPAFGWWGKVECGMSEYRNNGNMWQFFLCVKDKNAKAV